MTTLPAPFTLRQPLAPTVQQVDLGAIPYIVRMGEFGVRLDPTKLTALSLDLEARIEREMYAAWGLAGGMFNLSSSKQKAQILYKRLGLPTQKRTKGGGAFSTAEGSLALIKDLHPIVPHILEYGRLEKLKNTYVDTLPGFVGADGRIHPRWQGTRVPSGRLSCSDPNATNQPVRDSEGKEIRKAFIPEDGWEFLAVDLGQIELRGLAHYSQDDWLVSAFFNRRDIHKETAGELFDLPLESIDDDLRFVGKTCNFGVVYGLSPVGLVDVIPHRYRNPQIHTVEWATKFLENYFNRRPGIKNYTQKTIEFTRKNGYVEDAFGRRRWIPEVNSSQRVIQAAGERQGINHPIQSLAAGIIKLAMGWLVGYAGEGILDPLISIGIVKPIIQVHDELIFEVRKGYRETVGYMVRDGMVGVAPWMRVPLTADVEVGESWGELKKVKLAA